MLSVIEAGPYDRSLEMDYDEEVAFARRRAGSTITPAAPTSGRSC